MRHALDVGIFGWISIRIDDSDDEPGDEEMKDSIADECDAGFFNTTKLVMGPAADTEVWSDCLDFEVQRFGLRPRSAAKSGLVSAREACSLESRNNTEHLRTL